MTLYVKDIPLNTLLGVDKINVDNIDNIPPYGVITYPHAGQSVNGIIDIQTEVYDNIGISQVQFSINDSLVSIDNDKIVNVRLEGACVGCSVNQMTLKSGVEMTIKKYAPQIEQVINVE